MIALNSLSSELASELASGSSRSGYAEQMPRLDLDSRRRVIQLHKAGISVKFIADRLRDEGTVVMRQSLQRLIKKYKEIGLYTDLHHRKRDKKITDEMAVEINNELENYREAAPKHTG